MVRPGGPSQSSHGPPPRTAPTAGDDRIPAVLDRLGTARPPRAGGRSRREEGRQAAGLRRPRHRHPRAGPPQGRRGTVGRHRPCARLALGGPPRAARGRLAGRAVGPHTGADRSPPRPVAPSSPPAQPHRQLRLQPPPARRRRRHRRELADGTVLGLRVPGLRTMGPADQPLRHRPQARPSRDRLPLARRRGGGGRRRGEHRGIRRAWACSPASSSPSGCSRGTTAR